MSNDRPLEMSEVEFAVWLHESTDHRGLKRAIGGSQIGALLGMNKYKTPADVWDDLLAPRPRELNKAMDAGIRLEPVACDIYAEETGWRLDVQPPRTEGIFRSMVDRMISPVAGGKTLPEWATSQVGVLEVKCPDSWGFEATLANGIDASYYAQIQQYMMVEGVNWGAFAIFGRHEWRLHHFEVAADAALQAQIRTVGEKFWQEHVLSRVRPENGATGLVGHIPLRLGADAVVLLDDESFKLVRELQEAKQELNIAEKRFGSLKEAIQGKMIDAGAEVVRIGSTRISWKEVTRRTLSKEKMVEAGVDPTPFYNISVSRTFLPKFG